MKTIILLFACTCVLGGLSALNIPLEDENFNVVEAFENALKNENVEYEENLNFPHPTPRPIPTRHPRPTTSEEPTTIETSTTIGPLPPTLRSRNVQIYENTVRGLGPFASQLLNMVLNRGGRQNTNQENEILYNFNE